MRSQLHICKLKALAKKTTRARVKLRQWTAVPFPYNFDPHLGSKLNFFSLPLLEHLVQYPAGLAEPRLLLEWHARDGKFVCAQANAESRRDCLSGTLSQAVA